MEANLNDLVRMNKSLQKLVSNQDFTQISNILDILAETKMDAKLLKTTGIGKFVNKFLRKSSDTTVKTKSVRLLAKWKAQFSAVKQMPASDERKGVTGSGSRASNGVSLPESRPAEIQTKKLDRIKPGGEDMKAKPEADRIVKQAPKSSGENEDLKVTISAPTQMTQAAIPKNLGDRQRIINMKTGDKVRDTARSNFAKALKPDDCDEDTSRTIDELGVAIEFAMFCKFYSSKSKAYKEKYRMIILNLRDKNNPDLKQSILENRITPNVLIDLKPMQLASKALQEKRRKDEDWAMQEIRSDINQQPATDQFKCGRCKERKCTYYQMQTRGADEPMTVFVCCVVCQNRWRC
eukprot:125122_1